LKPEKGGLGVEKKPLHPLFSTLHIQWPLALYLLAAVSSMPSQADFVRTSDFRVESFEEVEQLQAEGLVSDEVAWRIIEMLNHPINLNRAGVRELSQIPGLSESEATLIVAQRKRLGRFNSWSEVRQIPELTVDQFDLLRAFTQISAQQVKAQIVSTFSQTANDERPHKTTVRSRLQLQQHVALGLLIQHDDASRYRLESGADSASIDILADPPKWRVPKIYLLFQPNRIISQLVVGHFTAGFGSGLVFNDARRFRPRGLYLDQTISTHKQRGAIATWQSEKVGGALFASYQHYPSTQPKSGTGLDSSRRIFDAYREGLVGGSIFLQANPQTEIGLVSYASRIWSRFSTVANLNDGRAYSGLYAQTELNHSEIRTKIRGEVATGYPASFQQMAAYFETEIQAGKLSFLGSARHYGIQFDNPHSRGFADADDASSKDKTGDIDEVGLLAQVRYRPHRQFWVRLYSDQWRHPSTAEADAETYLISSWQLHHLCRLQIWTKLRQTEQNQNYRTNLGSVVVLYPVDRLRLTLSARRSDSQQQTTSTYGKVEWDLTPSVELEMRLRLSQTTYTQKIRQTREVYFQIRRWAIHGLRLRARYTLSTVLSQPDHSSGILPDLRHKFYLRSELNW